MTKDSEKKAIEDLDCMDAIRNLYAYLDGELDARAHDNVEHHLGHCRACYSRLEFEAAISERLKQQGKPAPKAVKNRLRELIEKF